jgi:hypothetical protein
MCGCRIIIYFISHLVRILIQILQTLIQAAHQGVRQRQRMHSQLVLDPRQHMKRCEES